MLDALVATPETELARLPAKLVAGAAALPTAPVADPTPFATLPAPEAPAAAADPARPLPASDQSISSEVE